MKFGSFWRVGFVLLLCVAPLLGAMSVYEGDGLTFSIELQGGDRCRGTIVLEGETYPFTGTIRENVVYGRFEAGGRAFEFTATQDGERVDLESGGQAYRLRLRRPAPGDDNARNDDRPRPAPREGADGLEDAGPIQVNTDTIIPWLKTNPDFIRMPHPQWMKPGVIVSYKSQFASSTRPIRDFSITRDGRIIDHRDVIVDLAGEGFLQMRVIGMHPGATAVVMESYLISSVPATAGQVQSAGTTGYLLPAGAGSDFWLHPDALQHLLKNPGGLEVFPMQHKIGDKTYDAIAITQNIRTGWFHHIYDARTGVLLTKAHLLGPTHGANDVLRPGDNPSQNTSMQRIDFVGLRVSPLPWADPQTPPQLINPRELAFEGHQSLEMAGMVTPGRMRQTVRVQQAARGWLQVQIDNLIEYQGQPPVRETVHSVMDRSTHWIDPRILADLRDREELDADPVTGYRTIVAGRQGGQICIVRVSNGEQQDRFYDLRSGEMLMLRVSRNVAGGRMLMELQRAR